jgi:hypothetical protein
MREEVCTCFVVAEFRIAALWIVRTVVLLREESMVADGMRVRLKETIALEIV